MPRPLPALHLDRRCAAIPALVRVLCCSVRSRPALDRWVSAIIASRIKARTAGRFSLFRSRKSPAKATSLCRASPARAMEIGNHPRALFLFSHALAVMLAVAAAMVAACAAATVSCARGRVTAPGPGVGWAALLARLRLPRPSRPPSAAVRPAAGRGWLPAGLLCFELESWAANLELGEIEGPFYKSCDSYK